MNPADILEIIEELSALPFFPKDPAGRIAVVRLAASMASDQSQIRWLVTRMTNGLYSQWPGPAEMRACFCSRFKPKDGIDIGSSVYVEGIPAERPDAQIAAVPAKRLAAGETVSEDREIDKLIHKIADRTKFRSSRAVVLPTSDEIESIKAMQRKAAAAAATRQILDDLATKTEESPS